MKHIYGGPTPREYLGEKKKAKSEALKKKKEHNIPSMEESLAGAKEWGAKYRASKKSADTSQARKEHEKKYGRENW